MCHCGRRERSQRPGLKEARCGCEEEELERGRVEARLRERSPLEAPAGSQVSDLPTLQS